MKKLFVLIFALSLCCVAFSQGNVTGYEFVNQEIAEIIYTVSLGRDVPIVCDDTVRGRASFRFSGNDFENAFDAFLTGARLYVKKSDALWTVSKVKIECNDEGVIQLDAFDVEPSVLCEKLSLSSNVPIIHDSLPPVAMSIHIANVDSYNAAKMIMQSFSGYEVTNEKSYVLIKKNQSLEQAEKLVKKIEVTKCENGFAVRGENVKVSALLDSVFSAAEKEFTNLLSNDVLIKKVSYGERNFDLLLKIICLQFQACYVVENDVYYILPAIDSINALRDSGKEWRTYQINFTEISRAVDLLHNLSPNLKILKLKNDVIAVFSDIETALEISSFIKKFDSGENVHYKKLLYISVETLKKNLPLSIKENQITDTGSGTDFFFYGSYAAFKELEEKLKIIDKPVPRIKYDVLVIQFENSSNSSWSNSFTINSAQKGDSTGVTGKLAPALDLKFDVVTTFGFTFANALQAAIADNTAKVFADTTLHGVSGSTIKFQNTSTFRYRDSNIDVETGKTLYSGVTREIVAGLILEVNGWVSGDGMITSNVNATVSRQGASSNNSNNPPITSEKVITTQVRSRSGEPVILSGLKQTDEISQGTRVPVLSKIPLLGWLFKNKNKTKENTEVVIYLVPHLEKDESQKIDENKKLKEVFTQYVENILIKECEVDDASI